MLQAQHPTSVQIDRVVDVGGSPDSLQEHYQSVLQFLRRQYPVIAFATAIMIALGLLYVFTARPSYTATADLLIDSTKVHLFQQQSMFTDMPVDNVAVESQVEILKSDSIALAVIKKLNLADDPEFAGSGGGLIGAARSAIMGMFAPNGPSSEAASSYRALITFHNRLKVERLGLTYLIAIGFRSLDADRAAQIANAVANAYIDDQLESKYQAARRAGSWLQDRLGELRQQASTAERAVVDFKNRNNMVDAGGRTINEQQLAELNSQLVLAQAQTTEARARLDRVQAILTSKSSQAAVDATVADTLKSDVINKLRSQYLELARREADWSARYGADHLAVVNLRNQMRELQNSIHDELQRTAETYKNDLEIATQREASLRNQLNQAVSQSQVTNQAQVALRQLETTAQSYQALYDNFLQRYMESVQQQSFPITEARVISAASRPLRPSDPRVFLVLGLATVVGLALGAAAGTWREITDRVFRTRHQVEELLQTDCIALVPAATGAEENVVVGSSRDRQVPTEFAGSGLLSKICGLGRGKKGNPERRMVDPKRKVTDPRHEGQVVGLESLRKVADHLSAITGQDRETQIGQSAKRVAVDQRRISPVPGVYSAIVELPFSAFAESIRAVKVAVDLSPIGGGARTIGFTSSIPNEGKSSIAVVLARLVAQTGARTLLVDCDLKNPSLSRLLAPQAAAGLVEVVGGQAPLEKAIWVDEATDMKFLPTAMKARLAHSSEVLASGQTRKLLDSLRHSYDYIFLDFAPLMPIVDVRVSTHLVDGYVYIVEWGKTRIDYVQQALRSARGIHEHLLGVVLNKVDLETLGRYDGRGDGYYHHGNYYDRYGYTQ